VASHPYQGEVIDMRRYHAVTIEHDVSGAALFGFPKTDDAVLSTLYRLGNGSEDETSAKLFRERMQFDGRSISVSDIIRVRDINNGTDNFYYCDSFGWANIQVKEVPNWIDVGMHATGSYHSDSYPFEVVKVPANGKVITICELDAKNAEGYDYYSNQVHTFKSNPHGATHTVRQHKNGDWMTPDGMQVYFGSARKYDDPHF
jgi:hypothetical protein